MTTFEQLSALAENKTAVFYSPIEGRDVLVRTGTTKEDSLLTSVLRSYSGDYARMDKREKKEATTKMKKKLEQFNDPKKTLEKRNDLLFSFYKKDEEGSSLLKQLSKNKADTDAYSILLELIPEESLRDMLVMKQAEISSKINSRFEKALSSLDEKRRKFFLQKILDLISLILKSSEPEEKSFLSRLTEKVKRDFYFLDSKTRLPYSEGAEIKNRKSLILLKIASGYEIVGRLLPGNHVQREFDTNDPLIRRINMFLYKPEMIQENYPTLLPYLRRERAPVSPKRAPVSPKSDHSPSPSSSRSSLSSSSSRSSETPPPKKVPTSPRKVPTSPRKVKHRKQETPKERQREQREQREHRHHRRH